MRSDATEEVRGREGLRGPGEPQLQAGLGGGAVVGRALGDGALPAAATLEEAGHLLVRRLGFEAHAGEAAVRVESYVGLRDANKFE